MSDDLIERRSKLLKRAKEIEIEGVTGLMYLSDEELKERIRRKEVELEKKKNEVFNKETKID